MTIRTLIGSAVLMATFVSTAFAQALPTARIDSVFQDFNRMDGPGLYGRSL